MLQEVITGLSASPKTLPSKYFYDQRGSELFEEICKLDEYYLTNAETELMQQHISDLCDCLGKNILLVELGSGSSKKTRLILENVKSMAGYVPVDISRAFLKKTAEKLRRDFPKFPIEPVIADYTKPFTIPLKNSAKRTVIYYPGSTLGNFTRKQAGEFLARLAGMLNGGDGLLIGIDRKKDRNVLEAAYNDKKGVTAAFNKNMLVRLNRELDANFDLDSFTHSAIFNEEKSRIEMHLVSDTDQTVEVGGEQFQFEIGETIHTENSRKYSDEDFRDLVGDWFDVSRYWTDSRKYFGLYYLIKK